MPLVLLHLHFLQQSCFMCVVLSFSCKIYVAYERLSESIFLTACSELVVSTFSCAVQMLATSTVTMSLSCLTRSSLHSQDFDPLQLYFDVPKSTKLAKYIVFQWYNCTKFAVVTTWKTAQRLLESWSSAEGGWVLIRKNGGVTTFRAHYMCTEMQNESDRHKACATRQKCELVYTLVVQNRNRPNGVLEPGGAFVSLMFFPATRCL